MRQFFIKAYSPDGNLIMTPILIEIPAHIALREPNPRMFVGYQATREAVAYVAARVCEELVRYGASECIGPPIVGEDPLA